MAHFKFDREDLDENDPAMFGAKAESVVVSWIAEHRKVSEKRDLSRAENDLHTSTRKSSFFFRGT